MTHYLNVSRTFVRITSNADSWSGRRPAISVSFMHRSAIEGLAEPKQTRVAGSRHGFAFVERWIAGSTVEGPYAIVKLVWRERSFAVGGIGYRNVRLQISATTFVE